MFYLKIKKSYTKVDPRFLIKTLVENPFSSKYGFKA
jgi:hypothetical protein